MLDIKTFLDEFHISWSKVQYLQNAIHVHEAAKTIATGIEQEEDIKHGVERLWWSIIRCAVQYENTQDKFVALLRVIKSHRFYKELDFDDEGRLWKDRPGLRFIIYDCWRYSDTLVDLPQQRIKNRTEWLNLNRFVALLTSSKVLNGGIFALWSLQRALDHDLAQAGKTLDGNVPAAIQWIFYAGATMYKYREGCSTGMRTSKPFTGTLLLSRDCKDRWAFWKSRLEQVQNVPQLEDSTRKIAEMAVKEMEKIEREQD